MQAALVVPIFQRQAIGYHMMVRGDRLHASYDRAFCRDTLGLSSVDAGRGWLIFALPPAEVAVHPAEENARTNYVSSAMTSRNRYRLRATS